MIECICMHMVYTCLYHVLFCPILRIGQNCIQVVHLEHCQPKIEGFFDIKVFDIKGFFNIEFSTFNSYIISFDIEVAKNPLISKKRRYQCLKLRYRNPTSKRFDINIFYFDIGIDVIQYWSSHNCISYLISKVPDINGMKRRYRSSRNCYIVPNIEHLWYRMFLHC